MGALPNLRILKEPSVFSGKFYKIKGTADYHDAETLRNTGRATACKKKTGRGKKDAEALMTDNKHQKNTIENIIRMHQKAMEIRPSDTSILRVFEKLSFC